MEVIRLTYPLDCKKMPMVLAIGYFDGVHLGHQRVLREAVEMADGMEVPAAAMTFEPHPRVVLGRGGYSGAITPLPEKMRLIEACGITRTYVVQFDRSFAQLSPQDFVENFLLPLGMQGVVVGFDFTFGEQGVGTSETLRHMSQGRYRIRVVQPVNKNGDKVSSILIREHLLLGQMEEAAELLGRHFFISGQVVQGFQRGRTIGFPTANLLAEDHYLIPKHGVYIVRGWLDPEISYYGVMNVGENPTFELEKDSPRLEAHLFDFSGDLYGKELRVEFLRFLREEVKFSGIEPLKAQIQEDVRQAKDWLGTVYFT